MFKNFYCMVKIPFMGAGVRFEEGDNELQIKYQSAHHELIASALATKMAHEIIPGSMVGCMFAAGATYAYSCNPNDVQEAMDKERENLFFIDVQSRGEYPGYAKRFLIENGIELEIGENDEESSSLLRGLKDRRKTILNILYNAEVEDVSEKPNAEEDKKLYSQLNILINKSNNENDEYKKELNRILQAVDYDDAQREVFKIKYKQKDNIYTNFFKNFKFFYGIFNLYLQFSFYKKYSQFER